MFFEGSEKKTELIVIPQFGSLRSLGREFWLGMVQAANADILSTLSNADCDAYLLSESSLFVWDSRCVMLTCGNTTLANSLVYFVNKLGEDNIAFASYQRKNEYLSHLQPSTFSDDLAIIRAKLPGVACRIGHLDSHHHYLYTSSKAFTARCADASRELLMYHICGDAADYLRAERQCPQQIRSLLHLDRLLPGFVFDDHVFEPFGYSINGLCDEYYFTIHITPQENSSYVSVETNLPANGRHRYLFAKLLAIFNPRSWDEIGFSSPSMTERYPAHFCLGSCTLRLAHGGQVSFTHYQQLHHEALVPEYM